jgi:hypothetical protein
MLALLAAALATFLPLTHWQREWIKARGAAETLRKKLFEHIACAPAEAKSGEISARALQLAYFERRQIAQQLRYFDKRIPVHHARRQRALTFPGVVLILSCLMCAAIVTIAFAPATEQAPMMAFWQTTTQIALRMPEQNWAKIMLFIVILTILINGVLYGESQIANSAQVARQFSITRGNLEQIVIEGGAAARDAVEADGPTAKDDLRRFVHAIHRALATDTEAWVAITAQDAQDLLKRET